ncbi:MAG: hypothetical protein KBA66_03870 [Leptospiraceae bacterium]|nr:hypothetical protein [Leptospiraceae bacterium]
MDSIYILYLLFFFGFAISIAISLVVFLKQEKLKNSNQDLYSFLYKLESTLKVTNMQIQDSIGKIGQGTNGAIEKFVEVLNINDNISRELNSVKDQIHLDSLPEKEEQKQKIEKILENSKFQKQNIHEIISRLQFEDITKQINTHVTELLTLVASELKKQTEDYSNPKSEEEIRKELAEEIIRLSTMQSERDNANKALSQTPIAETKKENSQDVTFF